MNDSIPALSSEFLSFVKVVKPQNFIGREKTEYQCSILLKV